LIDHRRPGSDRHWHKNPAGAFALNRTVTGSALVIPRAKRAGIQLFSPRFHRGFFKCPQATSWGFISSQFVIPRAKRAGIQCFVNVYFSFLSCIIQTLQLRGPYCLAKSCPPQEAQRMKVSRWLLTAAVACLVCRRDH